MRAKVRNPLPQVERPRLSGRGAIPNLSTHLTTGNALWLYSVTIIEGGFRSGSCLG
jgi:hypothetical protein